MGLELVFPFIFQTLCQWVLSTRKCYRNNVVYHNWSHALHTAQCMFAMLQTKELKVRIIVCREIFRFFFLNVMDFMLKFKKLTNPFLTGQFDILMF